MAFLPTHKSQAVRSNNEAAEDITSTKLKRFRFTETYDLSLLKAVRCVNAHVPKWGKAETLYDEALKIFLRDIPVSAFACSQKPSAKTITGRFKLLVARRREDVKRNSAASGIVEVYGEKEVLLDDLIAEIEEKNEAARVEKSFQISNEKKLLAAGETIRVRAIKRQKAEENNADDGNSSSARRRRSGGSEVGNSDEETASLVIRQGEVRQEMENGRLNLMRHQMALEEEKAKKEENRFGRTQDVTSRRLELDEKRFELEKIEREQSLKERKKMVDVMEMLCRKLE